MLNVLGVSVVARLVAAAAFLLTASAATVVPVDDEVGAADPGERPRLALETEYGRIVLELYPHLAPAHVAQVLALAREGFYDGTTFHRVVAGFLIQGGDPNSRDDDPDNDGHGGLEDRRLEPEFSQRPFQRGSVGMARDYRPDGASCQFFITLGRAAHLDGQYTMIGRVSEGMDVVDRIAGQPADARGHPLAPMAMRAWVMEPAPDHRDLEE